MDVTSLLNASSLAAEQQKRAEAMGTPSRNRTPWDAGGYALPINTIPSGPSTPPQHIHQNIQPSEGQTETPSSPRHKFSDSRSSLSSFTSSIQSANHSRFSSMSTVNSTHPLNSLAEALSIKTGTKGDDAGTGIEGTPIDATQSATHISQQRDSLSPTLSLDALALVAENRLSGQQSTATSQVKEPPAMTVEMEKELGCIAEFSRRPSSPSDAILIKRSAVPILRVNTGDHELAAVDLATPNRTYLSAPLENHHNGILSSKTHKRALSAPDFTGLINGFDMARNTAGRTIPAAEPTPPTSHHPDSASPTNIMSYPAPDTPPATVADSENQTIVCMYIPNCDTNSQPRKAISHIFGRNKMCTRLIPQHVWVHYCRKHYQRSRYRNPKEYAKLQCDLVQQQIRRVHEWSLNNAKHGTAGIVQDWGLAVRKREQKRLDEMSGTKRKRGSTAFDQDSEGENGEDGSTQGAHVPPTAVPTWLLELCGKGYSTQEILGIFNQLHTEILEDVMPCFPDIEILPNIVVDQDEPKSPKGYAKRTTTGHKRAQSLGVTMKPEYYAPPLDRRMSQPAIWGNDGSTYGSPIEKRRRPNDIENIPPQDRPMGQFHRARLAERPMDGGRRIQQLAHRPVFADINEHQAAEEEYYAFSPQAYQPPLAAPTPQRMNGQSMATHLENTNEHMQAARRPVHQRSQSDMGAFGRGRSEYPSGVSNTSYVEYQNRPSPFQEQAPHPGHSYQPSQYRWDAGQVNQAAQYNTMRGPVSHLPVLGHTRNHSTPMVQSTYPVAPMQGRAQAPQSHMVISHNPNSQEFYSQVRR